MLGTKYIVKNGDTLWDLSGQFLGDPSKWPLIYKHNNSPSVVRVTGTSIQEQNIIQTGQILYIPDQSSIPVLNKGATVRYAYFKSKAKQYDKYKDSIFLKNVAAPVTKVRLD